MFLVMFIFLGACYRGCSVCVTSSSCAVIILHIALIYYVSIKNLLEKNLRKCKL